MPGSADVEVLVADATDPAALADVARRARVVITTIGPYLEHGGPLVAACAEAGTDYVDLTGEPEFVDQTYLAHHQTAVRTGARLVHACGFDSIPHDLGAYFTVQQLPSDAADHPARRRPVRRHLLRRHLPLRARPVRPRPGHADDVRRPPSRGGQAGRRPLVALGRRQAAPRPGARLLAAPAADDRPDRRRAQRRRAAGVRPEVPLLPLGRHQDAALRRRRCGRGRRPRPSPRR